MVLVNMFMNYENFNIEFSYGDWEQEWHVTAIPDEIWNLVPQEVFVKGVDKDDVVLMAARASRLENQDAINAAIVAMLADPKQARAGITEIHFLPFNPTNKRTALTYIDKAGTMHRVSKGAPEQILDLAHNKSKIEKKVHSVIDNFAERGLRSLGVARQEVPEGNKDSSGGPWEFIALLPLFDPPRHDSAEIIKRALELGVNVKMITVMLKHKLISRDQLEIGKETGRRLGMGTNMYPSSALLGKNGNADSSLPIDELIEKADGFSGVFPEHKYEIVKRLQELKHICGMTGDGGNDAPALKKADIGIVVVDSTDAARSASDIVLTEPGLSVIISVVLTNRSIFQRMKNYTGLRPTILKHTLLKLANLLENCWQQDPVLRPDFTEIIRILQQIVKEIDRMGQQDSSVEDEKKDDEADDHLGNPSKGRGQIQSKEHGSKVSSRKLITDASKSSIQNKTSSEAAQTQNLIANTETQNLISSSDEQTLMTKPDFGYKTLDEEIARRLFLKNNPGMDLENLKEEEARFKAKKKNLKPKASVAKKPPRPKEKGIVIKEKSNTEASKPKTRSQIEIDPKDKGKGNDIQTLKRRKISAESKTTSDKAQVVQSEKLQAITEIASSDKIIKTSTFESAQVDLDKMKVADKKKLLWKNVKPSDPKKSQLLSDFLTVGLKAREVRDRAGLGSDEVKIKTEIEVLTRDPFLLTDQPLEDVTQKHLDRVISFQVVLDAHDKHNVKENLIIFFEDGRTYQMSESDVLNKSLKELQFFHYLLEVKSDITRRWSNYILKTIRDKARIYGSRVTELIPSIVENDGSEIPMKKNSAKLEVILKGKYLCYNEDSSHPRVIRLNDGLERNHISALRTAIYHTGSQNKEMKQVKTTMSQVLRIKEEKLISSFVKNHYGFRLTQ
ncbi:hypothetical protein AgCh_007860 [Apium graveolens]